jgi:hypothetical protein
LRADDPGGGVTAGLVWSYGGGTQSVAIAVLVDRGELPAPSLAVIADTGREKAATWAYTEAHVLPLFHRNGIEYAVAGHGLATVDLYRNGDLLIPAYTGDGGKLPTYCSNEWKKRVVMRYLRSRGFGPANPADMWMGFSTDEVTRAKPSGVAWLTYKWPLLFMRPTNRTECRGLVEAHGLPSPPRSACWMCPFLGNAEWRDLRDTAPDDFAKAVRLDEEIRQRDPNVYVHRSGTPLASADIGGDGVSDTSHECQTGFCFV